MIDNKVLLDMAIQDLSKACETMPYDKLKSYAIDGILNIWVASCLQERSFRVAIVVEDITGSENINRYYTDVGRCNDFHSLNFICQVTHLYYRWLRLCGNVLSVSRRRIQNKLLKMNYCVLLAVLVAVIVPEVLSRSQPLLPSVCRPCQNGACSGCGDFSGNCVPNGCSYKNECKQFGEEWTDNCNRMTCSGYSAKVVEAKCMNPDGSCVGHMEELFDPLCACIVMKSPMGDRANVACSLISRGRIHNKLSKFVGHTKRVHVHDAKTSVVTACLMVVAIKTNVKNPETNGTDDCTRMICYGSNLNVLEASMY
ncbi:unnamed protein product [Mytilus coruscus]|uniref:Uncharacterized protein n=1 Tax=Mytilus coruscus TaxID=42192 RepID=A0A6J8ATY4_MYTCO|nr:unnamed protein product [Mytilus coruscus]